MHEAILHIGTEKTGSTAVQNYLLHNSTELVKRHGVLFPYKTCGLISNFRLVLYTKSELDISLAKLDKKTAGFAADDFHRYENWKKSFSSNHTKAIKYFQLNMANSKVVYSSEHFHSRVQKETDIKSLRSYFDNLYEVPYYDYLSLAQRWSNAFGTENVKPVIFDSSKLKNGDVTKDFEYQIGLDETKQDLTKMKYQTSNERLSYSALQVLIEFNLIEETDIRLNGIEKSAIRQRLIREVHSLKDNYGTIRPARSEVDAFYKHYEAANTTLADTWLKGNGFSTDFSMYPQDANENPVVERDKLLTEALANCLSR